VNINYQLWLLRNLPEAVRVYIMEKSSLKDFAPEVRAIMKQMFPEMAFKINQYEAQKYGTNGYFDEETGKVMKGKRPTPPGTQEELPDPFASEEPEEDEEELTTAFVKSMVKIAQKLDLKKKYRLADKLTYILDMKTSQ
jgi:hypothetical protein